MRRRILRVGTKLVIIISLPAFGIIQLEKFIGWSVIIAGAVAIISLYIWYQVSQTKKRRESLIAKYQDSTLVEKLMERSFWQGQTSGQLLDSLGQPRGIDEKILKTKKKEIWKYNHQSGNRYGLRITLDNNDVVVGWDYKT